MIVDLMKRNALYGVRLQSAVHGVYISYSTPRNVNDFDRTVKDVIMKFPTQWRRQSFGRIRKSRAGRVLGMLELAQTQFDEVSVFFY